MRPNLVCIGAPLCLKGKLVLTVLPLIGPVTTASRTEDGAQRAVLLPTARCYFDTNCAKPNQLAIDSAPR